MDNLPKTIPVKKVGTILMGHRGAIRDIEDDALQIAKDRRRKEGSVATLKMLYKNANYTVSIEGQIIEQNNVERYKAQMIIKDKADDVIGNFPVWGPLWLWSNCYGL